MHSYKQLSFLPPSTPTIRIWLSLFLIALGLLVLIFHPFSETRARYVLRRIPSMRLLSAATLQEAPLGSEVLVEGQIWEGSTLQFQSFVAYVHEDLVLTRGLFNREWRVREQVTPPLIVTVSDGQVQVVNADYSLLRSTLPAQWRPDFPRFSPSERYRGLLLGSRVVIFGTVREEEQGRAIMAEYVASGSQLALSEAIADQIGTGDTNLTLGHGLIVVGGWVLLISVLQALTQARRRRIQSPQS